MWVKKSSSLNFREVPLGVSSEPCGLRRKLVNNYFNNLFVVSSEPCGLRRKLVNNYFNNLFVVSSEPCGLRSRNINDL